MSRLRPVGAVESWATETSWACSTCGLKVRETRACWAEGREKLVQAAREREQAMGKERGMGS